MQPDRDPVDAGQRAAGSFPAPGPAGELALDVAFRPAEIVQADRPRVDAVQCGKRVHERLAQAPRDGRVAGNVGREPLADDEAMAPLQHVEVDAQHVGVGTQHMTARRERVRGAQPRQHAVLALHVVGGRRHRAARRPPQHILPIAAAEQVGEVGVAAAELSDDLQRPAGAGQVRAQPGRNTGRVEPLVGPHVDQFRSAGRRYSHIL